MAVRRKAKHSGPAARRAAAPARPRVDSVERFLSHAGDAWTFLVLREAFFGVRRFDEFQRNLDAAPNVLADRLRKLVAHGVLERTKYQERPTRFEYRLTEKGLDIYPAIVLMMRWADRWLDEGKGAPLRLVHESCGKSAKPVLVCDVCGEPVTARAMRWRPGPGAER